MNNKTYSSIEKLVAVEFERRNIEFEHDYRIAPYYVDFFLDNKVIVECDYKICTDFIHNHCQHTDEYEKRRERFLIDRGFRVIHIWKDEIENNLNEVINNIESVLLSNSNNLMSAI